jgi:hypothetical protein
LPPTAGTDAGNITVFDLGLSRDEIAAIETLEKGENGRVRPNPDSYEGI